MSHFDGERAMIDEAKWKKIEAALHKAWSAQSGSYNKAAWKVLQQDLLNIKEESNLSPARVEGGEDVQKMIDSPFNACQHREHCRSLSAQLAEKRGLIVDLTTALNKRNAELAAARDLTVPGSAALFAKLEAELAACREDAKRREKERRDDARDAATESMWKERQGDDYGSY
jgi:hypothetical protein